MLLFLTTAFRAPVRLVCHRMLLCVFTLAATTVLAQEETTDAGADKIRAMLDSSLHGMLDREAGRLRYRRIDIGEEFLSVEVPRQFETAVTEVGEGVWTLYMNETDGAFELSCLAVQEANYVGNGIASFMDVLYDAIAADEDTRPPLKYVHGQTYNHGLELILDIEASSIIRRDGKPVLAYIRSAGGFVDASTLVCATNVLGYRDTFQRVVTRLITSGRSSYELSDPYFQEVYRASIGDTVVGFSTVHFARDADGDTEFRITDTAIGFGPEHAEGVDSIYQGYAYPDGRLINGYSVMVAYEDEAGSWEIEYVPESEGDYSVWRISGEIGDEEIETLVGLDAALGSPVSPYLAVQRLFDAPVSTREATVAWNPMGDPTTTVDEVITVDGPVADGIALRIDRTGVYSGRVVAASPTRLQSIEIAMVDVPDVTMVAEQVFSKGAVRQPAAAAGE